jgi:hypothetical protein
VFVSSPESSYFKAESAKGYGYTPLSKCDVLSADMLEDAVSTHL